MNSDLSAVAKPGDPDLDLDLDAMVLTNVVVAEREVLISAAGGHGRWVSTTTGVMTDVDFVEEMSMYLNVPRFAGDADTFQVFVDRLCRWRDERTELRMCAAPGRFTTLIETADCWVPLPRRNPPDGMDQEEG